MLLYFVVVVVIGFVYAKRSNSSSGGVLPRRPRPGTVAHGPVGRGSDMSGWLLMGLPGVAYFTDASDAMWTTIAWPSAPI